MNFEKKIAATGFIFVGKVIEITEDRSYVRMPSDRKRYLVRLKSIENFKGVNNDEITLVQYEVRSRSSRPQWNLQLDETYLIYANKFNKDIRHEVKCSPTRRFDSNSPAYKELQKYKASKTKKIKYKRNYIKL